MYCIDLWYCIYHSAFSKFIINKKIMKKNMGTADRIIRVIIAAIIATLYFTGVISGTLGIVLLVLAGVFVLTGVVSFCPLYAPFRLSTCPSKENE
jgi:fatty acid desaturase